MRKSIFTSPVHVIILALLTCFVGLSVTAADEDTGEKEKDQEAEQVNFLFGNHECPVTGERVDDESFVAYRNEEKDVYGRVYMCCGGCEKKVEENLEKLYQSLYRKDKKTGEEKDPVDLKNEKCPMSGEPVIEEATLEYNGMIVHFCCPGCGQDFLENPDPKLVDLVTDKKDFEYDRSVGSGTSKEDHENHHESK